MIVLVMIVSAFRYVNTVGITIFDEFVTLDSFDDQEGKDALHRPGFKLLSRVR